MRKLEDWKENEGESFIRCVNRISHRMCDILSYDF